MTDSYKTVTCPHTMKELYKQYPNDKITILSSFGICVSCNAPVSENSLFLPGGVSRSSWPMEYEGMMCKKCYDLPMTKEELASIPR